MNEKLIENLTKVAQAGGLALALVAIFMLKSIEGNIVPRDGLDSAIVPISGKLEYLGDRFTRLETRLDKLDSRESRIAVLEAQMNELKHNVK